ncbi:MAG: MSHA biogenesis protein MshJ [Candidatus Pelagadaptatus aseana]|uniref:type II secretion system protein GspM n=1 Tax=Candidatus Pelagadaptatus aseana TaxID=3120508 RepID=UPI0039B2E728
MMDSLNNSELAQKYQVLSTREKVLLIGAAVVVLFLLFNLMLLTPLDEKRVRLQNALAKEQEQQVALSQQLVTLSEALASDPDKAKKQQLQALSKQLQTLDKALAEMSAGLVPAGQLAVVLRQVLENLDGVDLVSMNTLAVEELKFAVPQQAATEQVDIESLSDAVDDGSVGMFKHGVAIKFSGSYFAVIDYLKALEELQWRFYWELVDYQVADYPKASVELQVYTLSTEIGALGS